MNITVLFEARYTCTYKFICLYNTLKSWLNIFIDRFAGNEESDEMISLHSSCKSLEGKKKVKQKRLKEKTFQNKCIASNGRRDTRLQSTSNWQCNSRTLISIVVVFISSSSCSNIPGCGDWVTLCGFSFRHGPFVPTTTITVRHSKSTDLFKE